MLRGVGRFGFRSSDNQTKWVAISTPTDTPKSVRKRCVIELLMTIFLLSLCLVVFSVGKGTFVKGSGHLSAFSQGQICSRSGIRQLPNMFVNIKLMTHLRKVGDLLQGL